MATSSMTEQPLVYDEMKRQTGHTVQYTPRTDEYTLAFLFKPVK